MFDRTMSFTATVEDIVILQRYQRVVYYLGFTVGRISISLTLTRLGIVNANCNRIL